MSSSCVESYIWLKGNVSWEYLSISYTLYDCFHYHLLKQWTIVAVYKLVQPVYTPHGEKKVILQRLFFFFFSSSGWQWRSVFSIHSYMLNLHYDYFVLQVFVISGAPHMTDLCALGSSVSFSETSRLMLILLWLVGVPLRLLIMSSEVEKATGSPVKCWWAVDSGEVLSGLQRFT